MRKCHVRWENGNWNDRWTSEWHRRKFHNCWWINERNEIWKSSAFSRALSPSLSFSTKLIKSNPFNEHGRQKDGKIALPLLIIKLDSESCRGLSHNISYLWRWLRIDRALFIREEIFNIKSEPKCVGDRSANEKFASQWTPINLMLLLCLSFA